MKKVYKHNKFTAVFTDENGYFSLTGDFGGGGGAVGDRIAEICPDFAPLEAMHLHNSETGEPMHALENGFYHFQNQDKETGISFDHVTLERYWSVKFSKQQIERLYKVFRVEDGLQRIHDYAIADAPTHLAKARVAELMEEIRPIWQEMADSVRKIAESIPEDLTEIDEDINIDDFTEPEKVRALAALLGVHFSTIEEEDNNLFTAQGKEYLVLTDDEAGSAWDDDLENYIDECLEIPEEKYFDREAWKEDARMDGRGHSLGRYDGIEHVSSDPETGETFFIYRQ